MRHPLRLGAGWIALVAMSIAPLVVAPGALGASASQLPGLTTEVAAPRDAATSPAATLLGTSCVPANGCISVGSYQDASRHVAPMLAESVNGAAIQATRGALPASSGATSGELRAVSCARFEACLAAGDYTTASGRTYGYVDGVTGAAQSPSRPPLPPDAATDPHEEFVSASCPPSGGCAIVGTYETTSAATVPVIERLGPDGRWLAPLDATAPAGATSATLGAVSCWATGSCLAAGTYTTGGGVTRPYDVRLTGFSPGAVTAIALPPGAAANPRATTSGSSCTSASSCVVGGSYRTGSGATELYAATVSASGSSAIEVPEPGDAAANPGADGGAVSCAAAMACLLVGSYATGAGSVAGLTYPISATPTAQRVVAPAQASGALEALTGVSCTGLGKCTVVGSFTDTALRTEATTGAAFLAPSPIRGLSARQVTSTTVRLTWSPPSMPGAGVGWYTVTVANGGGAPVGAGGSPANSLLVGGLHLGHRYRFAVTAVADDLASSSPDSVQLAALTAASAPLDVRAAARPASAVISWARPSSSFGNPVTGYLVSVAWSGGSERVTAGTRLSVTIPGLAAGRVYTFEVAAITPVGAGTWSAPASCTPTA